jgi:hypothetical protein
MQTQRPAERSSQAPGPRMRARRDKARAEAVERLARWKRGIAAGTVVACGVLRATPGPAVSGPPASSLPGYRQTDGGPGPAPSRVS